MVHSVPLSPAPAIQSATAGATQCRASLRPRRPALLPAVRQDSCAYFETPDQSLDDLARKTEFRLESYPDVTGNIDRIVSVGMFEHVGVGHCNEFFQKCAELLDEDVVMLLHFIGHSRRCSPLSSAPALVADVEILRLHYAETANDWGVCARAPQHLGSSAGCMP
jgi:hypothetical protein